MSESKKEDDSTAAATSEETLNNELHKHKRFELVGSGANYDGGGIRTSLHGVVYQINLLMLYLNRALKQKYVFSIGTEVDAADKFDDLVFKYEKEGTNSYKFLQAKHRQDESKNLTESDFINETGGHFSVQKYFISYLKIKNMKRKLFKGEYEDFTICTNLDIESSLESIFCNITDTDPLLGFDAGKCSKLPKRLKLIKGTALYKKLEKILQKNPDLPQLAQKLGEKMAKSNVIIIDALLTDNRDWVMQNIFDECSAKIKVNKHYFKLRDNFLNPTDEDMKNMSDIFLKAYKFSKYSEQDITEETDIKTDIKQELSTIEFQLAKNFIKAKSKDKVTSSFDDQIESFLEKLVFAVNQPNEVELKNIVEEEVGNYMGLIDGELVASKLQTCILDWAKKRHGSFITSQDCLDLFTDVENQLACWRQLGFTITHKSHVDKYGFEFKTENEKLQELDKFLKREKKAQILIVYYNSRILTESKLMQLKENAKMDEFLFSDIKKFTEQMEIKAGPIKAFSSRTCDQIFLTINSYSELTDKSRTFLTHLLNVISNRPEKQIVLLVPLKSRDKFEDFSEEFLGDFKYIQIKDNTNKFTDLTLNSQTKVLSETIVKYHGCLVPLEELISDDLKVRLRGDILSELVCGELELQVNETKNHYKEVKEFCIDRFIQRRVIISEEILVDIRFTVVLNCEASDLCTDNDVLIVTDHKHHFEKLCKTNKHVHWLTRESCYLIWRESTGSINKLRAYIIYGIENKPEPKSKCKQYIDDDDDGFPNFPYEGKVVNEDEKCHSCCADDELRPTYMKKFIKKNNNENQKPNLNEACRFCVTQYSKAGTSSDDEIRNQDGSIKIKQVTDLDDRIVIISAEPGMGKSILLSQLQASCSKSRTENISGGICVIKADLRDYSQEFSTQSKEKITAEQVINFIFHISKLDRFISRSELRMKVKVTVQNDGEIVFDQQSEIDTVSLLKIRLFSHLYNEGKIVILLDGFDEIVPNYTDHIISLLHALKQTRVNKIWVTTRPYNIDKMLENQLNTFAYKLKPLSVHEQNNILIKFWESRLNIQTEVDNLEQFLLTYLPRSFWMLTEGERNDLDRSKFMGIPLHVLMIATLYEKDFIDFHNNLKNNKDKTNYHTNRNQMSLPPTQKQRKEELSLYEMYTNFFNLKFKTLYSEINFADPRYKYDFEQKRADEIVKLRKLGMLELFEDDEIPSDLLKDFNEREEERQKLLKSVSTGNMKIGLVDHLENDTRPRFVHRTYAEYFAADFLADALLSRAVNEQKFGAAKDFLYRFLVSFKQRNNIFTFLNYKVLSVTENSEIFNAIINHDINPIRKLQIIKKYKDIKDPLGRSLVHLMYNSSNNEFFMKYCPHWVASHLFDQDDLFKWTPLHYTIMFHQCSINISGFLHKVVDNGAMSKNKEELKDDYGMTPYILAAKRGCSGGCIKYFLQELPLDIDAQDNDGMTALHHALNRSDTDAGTFVMRMISNGANLFIANSKGEYPCKIIFEKKSNAPMKPFIDYQIIFSVFFNSLFKQKPQETITLYSEQYITNTDLLVSWLSSWDMMMHKSYILVDLCMDINMRDSEGYTALHKAFKSVPKFGADTLIYLLEMNADVNIVDKDGLLPSHYNYDGVMRIFALGYSPKILSNLDKAVSKNQIAMKPFILSMDFDASITVQILSRFENIANILIANGTDVDVRDDRGKTALHHAIKWKLTRNVSYLLAKGANIVALDAEGKIPLEYMTLDKNIEKIRAILTCVLKFGVYYNVCFLYLEPCDKTFMNWFFEALIVNELDDIEKYVIETKINDIQGIINVRNAIDGFSPLHFAAKHNNKEAVKRILRYGAVYNMPDENNALPSDVTSSEEVRNIFQLVDNFFKSIIDNKEEKVAECIAKGVILNAEIKYRDEKEGIKITSALHLAIKNNNVTILEMLLKSGANKEMRTSDEELVLHTAAKQSKEVMEVLLNHLSLEKLYSFFLYEDIRFQIPLVVAVNEGNAETLKVFLDKCTFFKDWTKFHRILIFERVTYVLTNAPINDEAKVFILQDYFSKLFD